MNDEPESRREPFRLIRRETPDEKEIARLKTELAASTKLRDEWCTEYVKARDALKAIYEATEGYADGAEDATDHAKVCNEIASIALSVLGRDGAKGESK